MSNIFSLFSELLGRPWAIDYREAFYQTPLIMKMMDDHALADAFFRQINERHNPDASASIEKIVSQGESKQFVSYPIRSSADSPAVIPAGSTALIPITGTLRKSGGLCSYGMEDMIAWINHAEANDNIDNIILLFNTPGGTVSGTVKLADRVRSITKPNVAIIDDLCASAGVWIASGAGNIIAINDSCEIGSIGVACYFADMRKMYEADGVVFHDINADPSPDKNNTHFEALKGNYGPIRNESLNPMAAMFIATIEKNRPIAKPFRKQWSTGKVFYAPQALQMGLIDGIGNMSLALEFLENQKNNPSVLTTNPTNMDVNKIALVALVLGLDSIESTAEGVFLNEEQLEQLNSALTDANNNASSLQQMIDDLNAQVEILNSAIADATEREKILNADAASKAIATTQLQERIQTLQAEIEQLKEEPVAAGGGAQSDSDFNKANSTPVDPLAQKIFENNPIK